MKNRFSQGELATFFIALILALVDKQLFTIYVGIGFTLKVGYFLLHDDESANQEPATNLFTIGKDLFDIVAWPWFAMNVGFRMVAKVAIVGGVSLSLIAGGLYWAAIEQDMPENVVAPLIDIASDNESPIPMHLRADLNERIENGFEYGDYIWFVDNAMKFCGDDISFNSKTPFVQHLTVGVMRAFPAANNIVLNIQTKLNSFECLVKKVEQTG